MRSYPLEAEQKQEPIAAIQERVNEDPEVSEALFTLVESLELASTEKAEDKAWATFTDSIAYIISRAKNSSHPLDDERDEHEDGISA